jgi:hypothetical protein
MPRTKDPTGLDPAERTAFRVFVRATRAAKAVTNQQIADALGWDVFRVANALRERRAGTDTLLAETAYSILEGLHTAHGAVYSAEARTAHRAVERILSARSEWEWVRRYRTRTEAPGVFLVRTDVDRLAALLADDVATQIGAGPKVRAQIEAALARALLRNEADMALSWFSKVLGPVSRVTSRLSERSKRHDSTGVPTPQQAQHVLELAMRLCTIKTKKGKK